MLTAQCTDISQSMCACLILKWSIQNTTDLRDAKKASFLLTLHQDYFSDPFWKLLVEWHGNRN